MCLFLFADVTLTGKTSPACQPLLRFNEISSSFTTRFDKPEILRHAASLSCQDKNYPEQCHSLTPRLRSHLPDPLGLQILWCSHQLCWGSNERPAQAHPSANKAGGAVLWVVLCGDRAGVTMSSKAFARVTVLRTLIHVLRFAIMGLPAAFVSLLRALQNLSV